MFDQRRNDEVVVDAVEGLGVISEKYEVVQIVLDFLVVVFVDVAQMVSHPTPRQKHLLVIPNELLGSIDHC